MSRSDAAATKRRLLEAANRVTRRDGVARLTLDAVAAEAGVSKGGVLYHFPSKDALIRGMLGLLLGDFDHEIEAPAGDAPDDETPGGWLRAYVRASAHVEEDERHLSAAILAAVASDPALLDPVRERFSGWQARAERDGIDPALATVVRLAADGLWIADLLGLAPPDPVLRSRVIDRLLELASPQEDAP